MSDEIKQIAALIGHHQALEKRVSTLTEEFQAASVQLQRQSETLSKVIRELDSASGNMTDTVRKSVSSAMNQVTQALTQAGTEQQKPAVNALNQVVKAANDSVNAMRREMYRYTWKSAIYLVLTIFFVLACRKKRRWLISLRVTESPALRWTPAPRMGIKRIPG